MIRILVIENNHEIRNDIVEILSLSNYLVDQASNGKSGIELALKNQPDLVLCDIMMPVLDGFAVLHLLQKNNVTKHIPFIFITAKLERSEIRKGMEMGADDYIFKPFDGAEVLNAVASRLKKAKNNFNDFNPEDDNVEIINKNLISHLKGNSNINHYKKKQVIFSEGNAPSKLFYLMKGKVKTYKRNQDGKELIINLYTKGDFIGYVSLLNGKIYQETAEALADTELAVIPRGEFEALLGSNPQVMKRVIAILARSLNEQEDHLLAVAYDSLRKKVADGLIYISKKYNPENNTNFGIEMTRENLASIAGVAKESLIRMLAEFKEEGLITITDAVIHIIHFEKLQHMHN